MHHLVLGIIPDCELSRVASVGNAGGAGARIALLDSTAHAAIEPKFQAHIIDAMAIPHKNAGYPELRKVVMLPAAKESAAQGASRGRRGRRGSHGPP